MSKTISIADLKLTVNEMLSISTCSPEQRMGTIVLFEHILYTTDNYEGFAYLGKDSVPEGHLPGRPEYSQTKQPDIETDRTRVQFI